MNNNPKIHQGNKTLKQLLGFGVLLAILVSFFLRGGAWSGENPGYATIILTILLSSLGWFFYRFKIYGRWAFGLSQCILGVVTMALAIYVGLNGKVSAPDDASEAIKGLAFVLSLLAPMFVLVRGLDDLVSGWKADRP